MSEWHQSPIAFSSTGKSWPLQPESPASFQSIYSVHCCLEYLGHFSFSRAVWTSQLDHSICQAGGVWFLSRLCSLSPSVLTLLHPAILWWQLVLSKQRALERFGMFWSFIKELCLDLHRQKDWTRSFWVKIQISGWRLNTIPLGHCVIEA